MGAGSAGSAFLRRGQHSAAAKLKEYLPGGTFMAYTSLETIIFLHGADQCDVHQKALFTLLFVTFALFSFVSAYFRPAGDDEVGQL